MRSKEDYKNKLATAQAAGAVKPAITPKPAVIAPMPPVAKPKETDGEHKQTPEVKKPENMDGKEGDNKNRSLTSKPPITATPMGGWAAKAEDNKKKWAARRAALAAKTAGKPTLGS